MSKETAAARPLSPHLQIYRLIPTMLMSIVHRITGGALYFGTLLLAWWLVAAATSEHAFDIAGSFFEAEHLGGDTDMVAVIAAILTEERRRKGEGRADWEIPMRPDHGQDILDDLGRRSQPGYPTIGRMKGLAELRGVMTALEHGQWGLGRA